MMRILVNDGLAPSGLDLLEAAGFTVLKTTVAQPQLAAYINEKQVEVLLVRGRTQVDKPLLDACPSLKLIGKAGSGLDNIESEYAKSKGIQVINVPQATARSVAELVFAHLLGGIRYLPDSNRNMPLEGDSQFGQLKKAYSSGRELQGKSLGIIGMGASGQEVAKMALGLGMRVHFYDHHKTSINLAIKFFDGQEVSFLLKADSFTDVLSQSDFISLHVPHQDHYLIGAAEFDQVKEGVGIINTSRGSVMDEVALVAALDTGKVGFAGLDVFESEPRPEIQILMNPKISLSPHIGGSTLEALERISTQLAEKLISLLK